MVAVPSPPQVSFVVGLDLGQVQDYSAAVVLRRYPAFMTRAYHKPLLTWTYEAPEDVGLIRFGRGTRYTADPIPGVSAGGVCEQMRKLLTREPLPGALLALDHTGVGTAVYDIFRRADFPNPLYGVNITSGWHVKYDQANRVWNVPKKDLVAAVQAVLQQKRLKLPGKNPWTKVLTEELANFRVKITTAANETYAAWRERDHDDLVLALAMALWLSERRPPLVRGAAGTGSPRVTPPRGETTGGDFRNLPRGI